MTMADERYIALTRTAEFLKELQNPRGRYKRDDIKEIRRMASSCLRHYPWEMSLEDLAKIAPHILENING
jgi:hypothetical protein